MSDWKQMPTLAHMHHMHSAIYSPYTHDMHHSSVIALFLLYSQHTSQWQLTSLESFIAL